MNLEFKGKKITGVLSVLPENEYRFEDEAENPNDVKQRRLKKIIGFGTRRRAKGTTTLSKMLLVGLNRLIEEKKLDKDEIGAIVVVTLSPDYYLPQISSILHGELGLSTEVFCVDIPQACAGFVVGLIESFMLLEHMTDKKVILCTGEIMNRKTNDNEAKFAEPSFGGDIANITIVENGNDDDVIYANVQNDGSQRNSLLIEDGGFASPMTPEKIATQRANNPCTRVQMDGSNVFNFVQKEVPPAIEALCKRANVTFEDIDYYLFHQPNKFMLQKLAEKMGVPYKKMPNDITENLGNSDSGTIPAVMTTDVAKELMEKDNYCCFAGFGGGLCWASVLMKVEPLSFCENYISNL